MKYTFKKIYFYKRRFVFLLMVEGIAYNEDTGLSEEYLEVLKKPLYFFRDLRRSKGTDEEANSKEMLNEELKKPVPSYSQYFLNNNSSQLKEIIDKANPRILSKLDKIVEKYNSLKTKTYEATWKARLKCQNIIRGKSK